MTSEDRERSFSRLPGFRDFLPEEMAVRNHIFEAWRRVSTRYGFREYDAPPLESLELYTEKSGSEIVEQLYHFRDRGEREVALRPEMTPSLARILGTHSRSMPKPIRWFSIPQLFRYERQQRGRLREHFQWNVDIVGEAGVGADAEVLAVAVDGLRELGLGPEDFRARVSDRRLLSALLVDRGVPEEGLLTVFSAVDKLEREGEERTRKRLLDEAGLDGATADRTLELLRTADLEEALALAAGAEEVERAGERMAAFLAAAEGLGVGPFLTFDLKIVRGLAYYTGVVFELFDARGELRAICGGGRYDRLLEWAGGEDLPAVGFGMGDVVLSELLGDRELLPEAEERVDLFVVAITPEQRALALEVVRAQRARGMSVLYPLSEQSVRKQFSQAASVGARQVIVLGPDEVERGMGVVREMDRGEEREVPLGALVEGGGGPAEEGGSGGDGGAAGDG